MGPPFAPVGVKAVACTVQTSPPAPSFMEEAVFGRIRRFRGNAKVRGVHLQTGTIFTEGFVQDTIHNLAHREIGSALALKKRSSNPDFVCNRHSGILQSADYTNTHKCT